MVNYLQKYIKYKEKYFNLLHLYGGNNVYTFKNLAAETIDISNDRNQTIRDVKRKIANETEYPYWFLISIIDEDGTILPNNLKLEQLKYKEFQYILLNISIDNYPDSASYYIDMSLLDTIEEYGNDAYYNTARFSEYLGNIKVFLLFILEKNGLLLEQASQELRGDVDVVLTAVKQNGNALQFASQELRADRKVVFAALKQNGEALEYASDEFRRDRKLVLDVVRKNGYALRFASDELRADREVVFAAVRQDHLALIFASDELRADRELARFRDPFKFDKIKYKNNDKDKDKDKDNNNNNYDKYHTYNNWYNNNYNINNQYNKFLKSNDGFLNTNS